MAKDKTKGGPANTHLHARVDFLQRAAAYLASPGVAVKTEDLARPVIASTGGPQTEPTKTDSGAGDGTGSGFARSASRILSMHLNNHLQQVARKSQIRLKTGVKRSLCKRCNSVLTAPGASSRYIENLSKGRTKPHADVLVITCSACAASKRFPVGATRQKRKSDRPSRPESKRSAVPEVQASDEQKLASDGDPSNLQT